MSEEPCYGSFIVKKIGKIGFKFQLVLILVSLRNQSLFITWGGGVGECLGNPTIFMGERRGISRHQQSLEEQLQN